jgi:hypothetical protein
MIYNFFDLILYLKVRRRVKSAAALHAMAQGSRFCFDVVVVVAIALYNRP